MRSTLHEEHVGDVIESALTGAESPVIVVNPARETIRELVDVLDDTPDSPEVRLLSDERPLKDLMDDFLVASAVADQIDDGRLAVRTLEDVPRNSLLVSASDVVSLVDAGGRVAGLTTDDDAFVSAAYDNYAERWDDAPEFSLRTPALSHVQETLAEDLGQDTAADFDDVLASLQTARGNGNGLDEVTISLLVAAKNGELLYDISKWGEDIGLASKATFSRTKTKLEDNGLIDTEKVPIDVGRPRLRLMLGDDRLQGADAGELASVAQSLLATQ
ncbi:transcriptional regulator TbsP [Halobacteriales archaeon Cl-PHB]